MEKTSCWEVLLPRTVSLLAAGLVAVHVANWLDVLVRESWYALGFILFVVLAVWGFVVVAAIVRVMRTA